MSFPLVGNLTVKSSVESFLLSDRIPHAILIEGDEGTGRHTLAAFLAKAAVCEEKLRPCDSCRACRMAENSSHPDISYLLPEDGKKNITVSQIRTLRAEAFIKPHMATRRVFVIDGADRMNEQSQNALLKVLEEPPPGVIFILICLSRTSLLETIISRCTAISLSCPEHPVALEHLCTLYNNIDRDVLSQSLIECGCNIGKAMRSVEGKSESEAAVAADDFIEYLFSGSEMDMLMLTLKFEKDRIKAEEFFAQLKMCISKNLKKQYKQKSRSRVLCELYKNIDKYEELLKTNINLSLLFSAVVCETRALRK